MVDKKQQEVIYGKEQQTLNNMKRFREIIQDNTAPSTSDLWITGGKLKYFDGGWKDLGGSEQISWDDIQGKPEFAEVATTGSYNDLSDKPTIPSAYTLPVATESVLGGVKSATTGTTSGRDYKVQINSDGTMKVNVPWVDTTYSNATQSANGLMSSSDKTKLDNLIEVPAGGTTGQVLKKTEDGVAWQNDNNTTYSIASDTTNGLMSSTDKSKLDNIAENANNYTLPNASASVRGGVLMAGAVADTTVDGTETATTVAATLNSLLAALRTAGVLTS